jgi:alpha-1,3-mannosyltransferase
MNRRSIGLALAVHALLGVLAVLYVTFTNIDWNAYMEQVVTVFSKGELDYTKIRGDTGPLVYPAGFLWLYWAFTQLSSLRAVQWVFLAMLLATSATLLLLATRLKQGASLPLWQALLLVSSRRVTSIFVLRLFNDAPAALLMLLAVLADSSYLATLLLSAAVSIKVACCVFSENGFVVFSVFLLNSQFLCFR